MKITPGCVFLVTLLIVFHFSNWVMAEKEVEKISDNETSSFATPTEISHQHQLLLESKLDGKLDNNIEGPLNTTITTTEENLETTTKLSSSTENLLIIEIDPLFEAQNLEDKLMNETETSTSTESIQVVPDTTFLDIDEIIIESSTSTPESSESPSPKPILITSDSPSNMESEESRKPTTLVLLKHPVKPTESENTVSDQIVSSSNVSNFTVSNISESNANVSSEIPPPSSTFPTLTLFPLTSNNSVLNETHNKENSSNLEIGSKKNHTLGIMDILKPSLNTQDGPIIIQPNETTTVEPVLIPVPQKNRHNKHKFRNSWAMCHNCGGDSLPQLRGHPLTFLSPPLPARPQSHADSVEEETRFVPVEADVHLDRKELLKRRLRFQRVKDFMRSISGKSPQELLEDKRAVIPSSSLKVHRNTGSGSLAPSKNPSDSASSASHWNPFTWFFSKKSQAQSRSESFIQTATSFVVDKLTQKFARLTGTDMSK